MMKAAKYPANTIMVRNSLITFLTLLSGLFVNAQKQQQIYEREAILHGDSVAFPLTIINAFPFISVEINGIKGKFMFDTGNRNAIEINDDMVLLKKKKAVGSGSVGSGETFTKSLNDTIAEVKFINGVVYRNLLNIPSSNLKFLQTNITPDCIGYVGYNFFKGYSFKLDYIKRTLTFYKNQEDTNAPKRYLKGEKLLAILNFKTRLLPNHPIMDIRIGGVSFIGAFDTGQYGVVDVKEDSKKILLDPSSASLKLIGLDGYDDPLVNVNNIIMDGNFKTNLKGLNFTPFREHVRKALDIREPNIISIGYRFFSIYKTVWDYTNKKIYILQY